MRRKTIIAFMLLVAMFVAAGIPRITFSPALQPAPACTLPSQGGEKQSDSAFASPLPSEGQGEAVGAVPTRDTIVSPSGDDSLRLAIEARNRHVDDSIRLDSLYRAKSNGIEAPINYEAKDSMVYHADTKSAWLFGKAEVKYQNYDLKSERMSVNIDSALIRATGVRDTTDTLGVRLEGTPEFTMGQDGYESRDITFNFKSKKGLIGDVYTEQQDGFIRGKVAKRDADGNLYLGHGTYTTCDKEHPDFYIALSRAKVRPGKDAVFGPAYIVVADVPLPLAIPYGFFPFTKSYSSGFIMPSYGDEKDRGFYLRDGGYYFAMSDKWDLKLIGEIYTRGSWGLSAASNYNRRYRHNGSFLFSYQDTKTGDKGLPDYSRQESFKVQWSHRQDSKANPFSSFSASVNFATSSYERNNLTSMYNPQSLTQSTRTSSVSYSTTFSSLGLSISTSANLAQNMRDSTIQMTLPDLNVTVSRFYPFRRKHVAGKERWYEKIAMSYTGRMSNSITDKEDHIMKANLIKEWRNGFEHRVPISGNFTVLNYINVSPSLNLADRMYSNKIMRSWDAEQQVEVADTTYGFHNVYDWNVSLGLSTKLYGFWTPVKAVNKMLGDKIQTIRHVLTPTLSFSYAPDFGTSRYGYWESYQKTDAEGNVSLVEYSPYANSLFGVPGHGRTGSVTMSLENNLEMKIKSEKDSTGFKKISLIDNLGLRMSYNMAAKDRQWSDLSMNIRLKWWKSYTFNMNAVFATYAYELDDNGRPYVGNHTEWGRGRFGRFQGMSQNFSFTLTPDKLRKLFGGGGVEEEEEQKNKDDEEGIDTDIETNIDDDMINAQRGAKRKRSAGKAETDDDGYMTFSMPWSITFGYGITMREHTDVKKFNTKRMRYPYKFTQTLNCSGNVRISDGWNISFSSGYDFEAHKMSMTTASLQRDLHCFNMSCSVVLKPYTSYNFSFRCNASTLTDALKYDKRSGYSNAVQWY